MQMPWDRLKSLRTAAGYPNPTSFAEAHDLKPPTYLSHERPDHARGHRGIKKKQAESYAKLFQQDGIDVTAEWILHGQGPDPLDAPRRDMPRNMLTPNTLDADAVQQAAFNVLELMRDEGLDEHSDIVAQTIVDLAGEYTRQRMEHERSMEVSLGDRVVNFPRYAEPSG